MAPPQMPQDVKVDFRAHKIFGHFDENCLDPAADLALITFVNRLHKSIIPLIYLSFFPLCLFKFAVHGEIADVQVARKGFGSHRIL